MIYFLGLTDPNGPPGCSVTYPRAGWAKNGCKMLLNLTGDEVTENQAQYDFKKLTFPTHLAFPTTPSATERSLSFFSQKKQREHPFSPKEQ